jgi:PAS domain S-box-containing protein
MLENLKASLKKPFFRYLVSFGAVGVALLLRETMVSSLGPDFPEYLVFYPTIMTVALLAGLWPALISIVIAAVTIFSFWLVPGRAPLLHIGPSNYVGLALFVVVCVFLTTVAELYRRSRQKAAAYDREQAKRQTQEALRRQAELLKLSFDAIIVRRIDGGIESWNRGAEELYGFSEKEAQGANLRELLQSPGPARWQELENSLRGSGEWFGDIEHATKDGRKVTVSSRQLFGRGLDGGERVLEIDRDITDQRRVEEELRRAHDELEEKVELRTADLQTANRTLLMVSACDQALVQISDERELTGVICQIIQDEGSYPLVWVGFVDEPAKGVLRCVASAGDRDGYLEKLKEAGGDPAIMGGPAGRATLLASPVVSLDIANSDEEAAWKELTLSRGFRAVGALPLLDARKTAFGVLVIHSDSVSGLEQRQVTLLKELADDLAFGITSLRARVERDQALKALELKATQLRALAGEIVRTEQRERKRIAQILHDQIQQLLVATLYGLEGMHDAPPAAEHGQQVARLSELVRECITMSRSLMSELSNPSFSERDLCIALGWLGAWMKEKHGLEVEVRCAESITADAEETRVTLLQSVRELLFNVVKHAGVRRAGVELLRGPNGSICVAVSDEGTGFDAKNVRAPGPVLGGFGLFSIQERLDIIGGGMRIESAAGRGSRVTVWVPPDPSVSASPGGRRPEDETAALPASAHAPAAAAERQAAPRPHPARRGKGSRIRVVLVDDHAVVREGIALQLRQQPDIEIVGEASDGAAALELVRVLNPDVVTMDVNMPGMNGVDAARAIHAEHPRTRIIGLSMSDESEQGNAMRSAGAARYLSKSASLDTLLEAIRDAPDNE